METLLLHTWHNGHPWEPVQCRTKQTDAFSFIVVFSVPVIVIWSFLWYLKVVTLVKNLYLLIQLNIFGLATFWKFVIFCSNIVKEANVGLSQQLLCTCNNEMSPSSVYGNSVQNCSPQKYFFLGQPYKKRSDTGQCCQSQSIIHQLMEVTCSVWILSLLSTMWPSMSLKCFIRQIYQLKTCPENCVWINMICQIVKNLNRPLKYIFLPLLFWRVRSHQISLFQITPGGV